MKFLFHPEAKFELTHSVEFYQTKESNLGLEFLEDVYNAITRVLEFPKSFPKFSANTRRCLVNRFPFAIIYQIRENEIFILAITHLSRKPGYWKERMKQSN
ncbi:MAG TPA: type II toxin-antitoxin system RelE/ParE family toxin [Ignavibacteriaceae bacterium]|nr:type II toxin-antitoxin system RelE/ParE family toxin [Ignavibacteriaceae bacterium]